MKKLLTCLIPFGGRNGDINECLLSLVPFQFDGFRSIKVLVDSELSMTSPAAVIKPTTLEILRRVGFELEVKYDLNTTSIIDMRRKLLSWSATPVSLFLDSDAILIPRESEFDSPRGALQNYCRVLANRFRKIDPCDPSTEAALAGCHADFVMKDRVPIMPLFVEGMRIEVGGRQNDKSGVELKAMSEKGYPGHESKSLSMLDLIPSFSGQERLAQRDQRILHGDTCLLLLPTAFSQTVITSGRLDFFDKRGIGGSDFAFTLLLLERFAAWTSSVIGRFRAEGKLGNEAIVTPTPIGIGTHSLACWHTASPSKGYWSQYAATDQYIKTMFPDFKI